MLHTRTAIEYRNGVAAVVPTIVGVDRIVDEAVDRKARLDAERAVDEVLADSFPASDPPSTIPNPDDERDLLDHVDERRLGGWRRPARLASLKDRRAL